MEEKKKTSKGLEGILVAGLFTGLFGTVLGMESNIQPFNKVRVKDASFRSYLEQGKEQYGNTIVTYALAVWTYPGARLGIAIHNRGLSDNSK